MTPKENLLNTIQFKETLRLPVTVIDGYLWMIRKNNLSFKDYLDMTNPISFCWFLDK